MQKKSHTKHIKYSEGQWFAVPLKDEGYALGIVARGNSMFKGGQLGYFFGPRYKNVPTEREVMIKKPTDAILVTWFGALGLLWGTWPLISSARPFQREEWPVPKFKRINSFKPSMGWLVEYRQDINGLERPTQETYCDAKELEGFPIDVLSGYEAIEIKLTKLLFGT
ncbi:MAG: immunity 26/phosphotriesterase HocA family protein [Anaerolineales bacterium]